MCQESETKLWLTPSHSACCPALRRPMSLSSCLLTEGTNGKDGDKDRTKVCCYSGINHQPQFPCCLGVCVWKQVVYLYCKSSSLSVFCVSLFPCFQCLYPELQILQQCKERDLRREQSANLSGISLCQTGLQSPTAIHTPFLCVYSVVL